ncbi:MAG: hypothetical protein HOP03_03480 [Lysobacter sp.]|nr:hypothetical protein [Lysobacter sp.]
MTRQFVLKWGAYVQRVYRVPVSTWAQRMVSNFVSADSTNFRNALKRDTFEGAMAELAGTGHRLSDSQAIDRLARLAPGGSDAKAVAAKFGDLNRDLVYTPVQPCRILDTRSTAAGAIPAGTTRSFVAKNASNFTSQGGSATDCGTLGLSATAVALNFTAVPIGAAGHATVYPFGTTQPNAASVNYPATQPINNAIIAQIPNPVASFDFTVYTTSTTHYVADIVGYFAPPLATALDCITVSGSAASVPANTYGYGFGVSCPVGYGSTNAGFQAAQKVVMADGYMGPTSGNFFVYNLDSNAQMVTPWVHCCRVPGR